MVLSAVGKSRRNIWSGWKSASAARSTTGWHHKTCPWPLARSHPHLARGDEFIRLVGW